MFKITMGERQPSQLCQLLVRLAKEGCVSSSPLWNCRWWKEKRTQELTAQPPSCKALSLGDSSQWLGVSSCCPCPPCPSWPPSLIQDLAGCFLSLTLFQPFPLVQPPGLYQMLGRQGRREKEGEILINEIEYGT